MVDAIYIHIPFCSNICAYCDFAKMYYNKEWINKYLDSLKQEIIDNYRGELINTIYIGGGTPSCLDINELTKLLELFKLFNINKNAEISFEGNIESIDEEKLKLLNKYGVNRISIGVQTFNDKYIKFLGRHHTKQEVFDKLKIIKKYFNNINIDLMYAFPNQTLKELEEDINIYLSLDIEHISTYSLIIEPNTKLYIDNVKNIDEDLDASMYELIERKLSNYEHYEISNFSKPGYNSKHNLVYWNNRHYYGFGLGASGYIGNLRYTNTRNIVDYINHKYKLDNHYLDINETIENEFILGLRKIKGIDKQIFNQKYNININDIDIVKKLIERKQLIDDGTNIYIDTKLIYISNSILVNFIGEKYE